MEFSQTFGTMNLLMNLATGRVNASPFPRDAVESLKKRISRHLDESGIPLERHEEDRSEMPIDFRFMDQMLKAAQDPDRGIGEFARGVRVGPGARLPRLPALYRPKRRWKLAGQGDPEDYLEVEHEPETVLRSNYPTVSDLAEKVEEVLEHQVRRGQLMKHTEEEAKRLYPGLVIASLGANRKEKSDGTIMARVLHDGTNGIAVNRRTRVQDQERCPMASDLKRGMREKATRGERTFALTADVKEAHRQVPVSRQDWRLLGCRVRPGSSVYVNTVGTFGISSASYYCSRIGSGIGRLVQYVVGTSATTWIMLVADVPSGNERRIVSCRLDRFLRCLCFAGRSSFMGKDIRRRHPHMGGVRIVPRVVQTGNLPEKSGMVLQMV